MERVECILFFVVVVVVKEAPVLCGLFHTKLFYVAGYSEGDKCLSSLLYLSTLDNKSENSKKFHSLLLIKCGKQRKLSTAL